MNYNKPAIVSMERAEDEILGINKHSSNPDCSGTDVFTATPAAYEADE